MSIYAKGSLVGQYEPSSPEELAQAGYVIGHEFATRPNPDDPGTSNEANAVFILDRYEEMPIIAAHRVAIAIHKLKPRLELAGVFAGPASNTLGNEGGTWTEFEQAVAFIGNKTDRPILVSQRRHAARAAKQAIHFGLNPLLPEDLPADFDKQSEQWWCKGPTRWAFREAIGAQILRHRDHHL